MLQYQVTGREGGRVTVRLRGQLVSEEWTARLLAFLAEHYVDDGVRHIRLDLSGLDAIDLEGLGALFALMREARSKGKRFTAEAAVGQVRQKLETTGVLPYLEQGRPD